MNITSITKLCLPAAALTGAALLLVPVEPAGAFSTIGGSLGYTQRDFDGDPSRLTEMDALVAYLQMLGTLVDVDSAAAQERLAEEKGR